MAAEFGSGLPNESAYFQSFGTMKEGSVYYDPFNTMNGQVESSMELKSKFDEVRKGMANHLVAVRPDLKSKFNTELKSFGATIGGAGTSDYVMNPIYLDRDIVDTSRKRTPMRAMIRRVTQQGLKAVYNTITGKSTASFQSEFEALSVSDMTPVRSSKDVKIIRISGYTSGLAQASVPSFNLDSIQGSNSEFGPFASATGSTAMDINVLQATRAIQEFEENSIFNGNSSTNAKAFDGIIALQSTTNQVDATGREITLDDLDSAYFNAYSAGGRPNIAVCDVTTYKKIKSLLQAKGGFLEYKDLGAYGFKALMVKAGDEDIPIIPSQYLSTTSGSRSLYMLDLSVWEMRVLLDMTYQPLAQVDDGNKFMIKMYEVLVDKSNAAFNASVLNITTA